jgi:DNA invertase Pin-like site-specific DNA recombinase
MLNNSLKNKETKQLRVALYLRVSTDEQTKGYGLSVQKDKLLAFIQSQDYSLDKKHIYTEEVEQGSNVIDVFINKLRRKLESAGVHDLIETVRGEGYVIR